MKIIQLDFKNRARLSTSFSFRGWNYAYISLRFISNAKNKKGYADLGTDIILVDKQ